MIDIDIDCPGEYFFNSNGEGMRFFWGGVEEMFAIFPNICEKYPAKRLTGNFFSHHPDPPSHTGSIHTMRRSQAFSLIDITGKNAKFCIPIMDFKESLYQSSRQK